MTPPPAGGIVVRHATRDDLPGALALMRGLAEYERYLDDFAVTEAVVARHALDREPPDVRLLVALDATHGVVGMLAYYFLPFTFRARPTCYIKELFVAEASRGGGVGGLLMRATAREAIAAGCAIMKWQVAGWNEGASRFYQRLGAVPDPVWVDYWMDEAAVQALANIPPGNLRRAASIK